MKKICFFIFVIAIAGCKSRAQHSFKYDNTLYHAVFLNDAFHLMDSMPDHLLLDVRSPGEYADTSQYTALNIGRIKGAVNINIDSISSHLTELKKYSDKPIFIYCSHSQRSRRVSKLLSENGFRNVYNINGGMSIVNKSDDHAFTYKSRVLETHTSYKNIAGAEALDLLKNTPGLAIIDIRTEKEFAGKDSNLSNNIGHLKNAINIPQTGFAEKFSRAKISKDQAVLLCDLNGYNSMDVVDVLKEKGFSKIYNLYDGLTGLISDNHLTAELRDQLFSGAPPFRFVDAKGCIDLLKKNEHTFIVDARPKEEFENKASMDHMNLGRLKNAVHLESVAQLKLVLGQADKTTPVLVYGSGNSKDAEICSQLVSQGYNNVYYLTPGLYGFVWSTANVDGCQDGKNFLVDHEGLY